MSKPIRTEEQILRSLERCAAGRCKGCDYRTKDGRCKQKQLLIDAANLIKRQGGKGDLA